LINDCDQGPGPLPRLAALDVSEIGKLAANVLPLGVDTFAIAAAVGAAGLKPEARRRITALFVAFEAGMPLVGLALGAPLAQLIGGVADYAAASVLIAVGAWMLFGEDEEGEEDKARSFTDARGVALVALGLSISLDELAIGFSLGLSGLPVPVVIAAIAVQAGVAAQLGLRLGARLSERSRELAEKLAGRALAALGSYLVIARLVG
jgi:putative Mn2+ efflux pump MntP